MAQGRGWYGHCQVPAVSGYHMGPLPAYDTHRLCPSGDTQDAMEQCGPQHFLSLPLPKDWRVRGQYLIIEAIADKDHRIHTLPIDANNTKPLTIRINCSNPAILQLIPETSPIIVPVAYQPQEAVFRVFGTDRLPWLVPGVFVVGHRAFTTG